MIKVVWTDSSLIDISQIYNYIALDSPGNADDFLNSLMDSAETQLSVSPTIGRIIPEMNNPDFREIIYGSYRVMYYFKNNVVNITHVRHGARNFGYEDFF